MVQSDAFGIGLLARIAHVRSESWGCRDVPRAVDLFQWRNAILSKLGPPNPLSRLVLITVSMPMKSDGTGSWEAQSTIAERAHVGLRTVKRHLELAERDGWIARAKAKLNGRRWRRTEYTACVPDAVYQQLPERQSRGGATVAPTQPRGGATGDKVVPMATRGGVTGARGGATDDNEVVPQLGPLILNLNSSLNTSMNCAPARTRTADSPALEERRRKIRKAATDYPQLARDHHMLAKFSGTTEEEVIQVMGTAP